MNVPRPRISAILLAELIDSMPGRVRKRLDAEPVVADRWQWVFNADRWSIAAGEETVELRSEGGVIVSSEQLQCSCLLTPKCFHVVACINILATATDDDSADQSQETEAAPATSTITEEMQTAARLAQAAVAALLRVGASGAGLLVQSSILRAAHQCRECGLVALGNTLLRIVEGSGRLRANRDTSDAGALRDDLASALLTAHRINTQTSAPQWLVGQSRRGFDPIDVRKLEGICAEPILTLSGYAGVCVYLQGSVAGDEDLFTVNELRPGDRQLVLQAYGGGIDLGTVTLDAKALCRGLLAVQNLQVSGDGRLGKGKTTRWAVHATRGSDGRLAAGRFGLPLDEQIRRVFQRALMSEPQRHGGWDLVAFDAVIVGPRGASVLVDVERVSLPWRLTIAIDDAQLAYRENLALLARCPGLSLRCLGRLRLAAAGAVDLIAIAPTTLNINDDATKGARPELDLPPQWDSVCNIGLDRLQRHHFTGIGRWSDELILSDETPQPGSPPDGLDSLRRRLTGLALGGRMSVPALGTQTHRREQRRLQQSYQTTATQLLDVLAISASQRRNESRSRGAGVIEKTCSLEAAYLACMSHLIAAGNQFEKQIWMRGFNSAGSN